MVEVVIMTIEKQFTVEEVANILRKSTKTIYRWIESGKIKAAELPGRFGKSSYLISKSELEKFGIEVKDAGNG